MTERAGRHDESLLLATSADDDPGLVAAFKAILRRSLGLSEADDVKIRPATILGKQRYAGGYWPMPSTAAEVTINGESRWVPWPRARSSDRDGPARLFVQSGRLLVLPIARLIDRAPGDGEKSPRYLDLIGWWTDALERWTYWRRSDSNEPPENSHRTWRDATDEAGNVPLANRFDALARVLRYALLGAPVPQLVDLSETVRLKLPTAPQWLRPVADTPLGRVSATFLMTTLALRDGRGADPRSRPRVPSPRVSSDKDRWDPKAERGIDPAHTPDHADVRLTGRIGVGVSVEHGELEPGESVADGPTWSASAIQIPYADHNDPRRLLLGAGMQTQAVELVSPEPPLLRTEFDAGDRRPFGVNLRVGYVAWRGLNHEDAWVVSRSAAERLRARGRCELHLAVGATELDPNIRVEKGSRVKRGDLLIDRFKSPTSTSLGDGETKPLEGPRDRAPWSGEIVDVTTWDLLEEDGVPAGWEWAPS